MRKNDIRICRTQYSKIPSLIVTFFREISTVNIYISVFLYNINFDSNIYWKGIVLNKLKNKNNIEMMFRDLCLKYGSVEDL